MKVRSYRDLEVWQKGIDFAEHVYSAKAALPAAERYGLSAQMGRAVVSIPANIAEGAERGTTKEFLHFIAIAQGSLAEVETLITIATRLGDLTPEMEQELLARLVRSEGCFTASAAHSMHESPTTNHRPRQCPPTSTSSPSSATG
jgi:four helix bundle protein